MMLRQASVLAMTVLPLIAFPAAAMPRSPVCREPSVVDEMRLLISARDYYAQIRPAWVSERPGAAPNVVLCRVRVLSALYDTPLYGRRPARQYMLRDFEVRIVPHGFVVRGLGAP